MDRDTCILTVALLDGETDARFVLADRLEEQGDFGLAQWARARKRSPASRLDFALGTLPHREALSLAIDFAEHVIEPRSTRWWAPNMNQGFEPLRSWLSGWASDDEMIAACLILDYDPQFGDFYDRTPIQRQVCQSLAGAAQNARLAARHAYVGSPKTHHYDGECSADTRKTARYARNSRPSNPLTAVAANRRDEEQWQLARTREVLVRWIDRE